MTYDKNKYDSFLQTCNTWADLNNHKYTVSEMLNTQSSNTLGSSTQQWKYITYVLY